MEPYQSALLKHSQGASVCHLPLIMLWAPTLYLHNSCCSPAPCCMLTQLHPDLRPHATLTAGSQSQILTSGPTETDDTYSF
jgi:hypothetical protein